MKPSCFLATACTAALAIPAFAESVTIVPPHAESRVLSNDVAFAETTFDESAYSVDAQHALSYTGFDAVADTSTTFLGGWWDFGAGAFLPTDASRRLVTLDGGANGGAAVKNVGDLTLAGTAGVNNKLLLKGASDMTVGKCILGKSTAANQNSEIWITGGSSLTCTDYLSFNDSKEKSSARFTGNKIVVSNENSHLVVQQPTHMDRSQGDYAGGVGGNHLIVTDKGRVDLQAFNIATVGAHSMSNRVTVSKGGLLTMTSLNMGTGWYSSDRGDYTTFEVLDGGVVTNTGALSWGYYTGSAEHHSSTIFVSNGTFICKTAQSPRMATKNCTVRLSGPLTKFRFSDAYGYSTAFFGSGAGGNQIIMENFVTNKLPITYGYSYTDTSKDNTIIVRTGACLDQGNDGIGSRIMMAGYNGKSVGPLGYRNKFIAESGASVKCTQFYGNAVDGFVGISNATITCTTDWYYNEHLGFMLGGRDANGTLIREYGCGTNMVLALSGTTPKLVLTGSRLGVDSHSTIRFDLPQEGYPAEAQPLIKVTPYEGTPIIFRDASGISFTGAEAMFARHAQLGRKGRYLLIETNRDIAGFDDVIAEAQATLPEGMTLEKVTAKNSMKLWLAVRPRRGLTIMID